MRNFILKSIFLMSCSSVLQAAWKWNLPEGVTEISKEVHQLHMQIFWICVGIGIVVFSMMLFAIAFHRKSLGVKPATFHENVWLEIAWTAMPFLILVSMAIPATRTLIKMEDASDPDITIKVVGYQWFWGYEYIDDGISIISNSSTPIEQIQNKVPKGENYLKEVDNPLVVPIGKKVRFLTTAADVQHSFWVPAIGYKKDCIPGFINEAWTKIDKPGVYRGKCAELCGFKHGYMPIELHAVTQEDYDKWLADKKAEMGLS